MEITVEVKGLDKLLKKLEKAGKDAPRVLGASLYKQGEKIMAKSKNEYVPVDTGNLRASGRVHPPKIQLRSVTIQLSYGGASAPYAAYVHEAPTNWNWNVAGTGPKYLERPAREAARTMSRDIANDIKGKLI